jgi:hypothetical protein
MRPDEIFVYKMLVVAIVGCLMIMWALSLPKRPRR